MNKETKLRIHNITAKAALKFGSEVWVLRKREEQRLDAAQMKFLRQLLGITKLDKEKNQCIRGENGSTEHSKGNKTVPEKVTTTRTEDGHKQTTRKSDYNTYRGWTQTDYQNKHYNINQRTKEHRTTQEEMEGTN